LPPEIEAIVNYLRKSYNGSGREFNHGTEGPIVSTLQREPDDMVRVLDDDGRVVDGAAVPDLADETLV